MKDIPVTALRPLWFAKWCALVPLALGLVAFTGFLAVGGRDSDLPLFAVLGLGAIAIGLVAALVGVVALVIAAGRGAPNRSIALRSGLLLGNVFLAAVCARATTIILALQVVEVVNESRLPVTALRIQGSNGTAALRELPLLGPGATWRYAFEAKVTGALAFTYRQGERDVTSGESDNNYFGADPATIRLVIRDGGEHQLAVTDAPRWHWTVLLDGSLESKPD